jgi:uncharacterized protein (TIGR02996 family)
VDEQELLAAVIEAPRDDALRLVCADWLEEHGNLDRAEFIRCQCELNRLIPGYPRLPGLRPGALMVESQFSVVRRGKARARVDTLRDREYALLETREAEWRRQMPAWARRKALLFRRGFMAEVAVTALQFLEHGGSLWRSIPLESISLQRVAPHVDRLLASPHLSRLTGLNLEENDLGASAVSALAASPNLVGLQVLTLYRNRIGTDGARSVACSAHLSGLTALDLGGCQIGLAGAEALTTSPFLNSLTWLDLCVNWLGDAVVTALTSSPLLSQLTALDLSQNYLGDSGMTMLTESPRCARLTTLELRQNQITDQGAEALASSPYLAGLTALDLRYNPISTVGAKALARSPHLAKLTCLKLCDRYEGCELGAEGWSALKARFGQAWW